MNTLSIIASIFAFYGYSVLALNECKKVTDIPLQANFNLTKYISHKWYQIESYPKTFEKDLNCVTAQYSIIPATNTTEDQVQIINSGFNKTSGQQVKVELKAVQDKDNPAHIKVDTSGGNQFEGQYLVIKTNYEHFSLVYSCRDIDGKPQESAWILSSASTLSQDVVANLTTILEEATGSNTTQFIKTDQNTCSAASQISVSLSLIALIYFSIKFII